MSRGRPVEILWPGFIKEVAGVVLSDDGNVGEVPSLGIRQSVAASELVK